MWKHFKNGFLYDSSWEFYRDVFTVLVAGTGLAIIAFLIGLNLHFPSMIFGLLIPATSNTVDSIFDRYIRPDE